MKRFIPILLLTAVACSEPASEASSPKKSEPTKRDEPSKESVTISGETFHLELAKDPNTRSRGLMYRTVIADDGGMLFVFPTAFVQSFWMANCLVDIDIIYLDANGRVTAFHQMKAEEPRRPNETNEEYRERMPNYPSRIPAQFVVELKGGTLDRLTVAEGDSIPIDVVRLRKLAE